MCFDLRTKLLPVIIDMDRQSASRHVTSLNPMKSLPPKCLRTDQFAEHIVSVTVGLTKANGHCRAHLKNCFMDVLTKQFYFRKGIEKRFCLDFQNFSAFDI